MSHEDLLIEKISKVIEPLGFDVIAVEIQNQRSKVVRVFIDFLTQREEAIGIEDCVKVTKALDEPLDLDPEVEAIFKGPYELEVSSPGVERPLRRPKDFQRFVGEQVRIHVFRPLNAEELENAEYFQKNSKQKHFVGKLKNFANDKIQLEVPASAADQKRESTGKPISIPFNLVSKAHLEPGNLFADIVKGK